MERLFRIQGLICLLLCITPDIVWGQVYTPQGSLVSDTYAIPGYYSPAQKLAIKQEYEQAYPRAIYIDEADPTYNCHAYAWHISEGGSHVWMGMSTNPTSIYWEDGSYIETTASDPEATKVSYPDDNHSAIVSTPSYYFISKWGNTCLFKHTKSDCPYQRSKTLRYFKLSMKISGKQVLVIPPSGNTVTSEYILSRVPVGASVEWVVDRGAATIVSGQGSDKVRIAFSYNSSVSAIVHCNTGLDVKIPSLHVIASKYPIVTDIDLFKYGQGNGEYTVKALVTDPTSVCTWECSGHSRLYEIPYPDDASFIENPNLFRAIDFYERGSYTISVYAANAVGIGTSFSKTFDIQDVKSSFSFSVSPNPVIGNVMQLEIVNRVRSAEQFTISVYTADYSQVVKELVTPLSSLIVDISSLEDGENWVEVKEGDRVCKQRLDIKRQ